MRQLLWLEQTADRCRTVMRVCRACWRSPLVGISVLNAGTTGRYVSTRDACG